MSAVFLKIMNMSITAGWLILTVILGRLLLKRAPKWIRCILWGMVAIRLICPVSFGSIFSLIPSSETIPENIAAQQEPAINSGIAIVNDMINPVIAESFTKASANSTNSLQSVVPVAATVWICGIVIMLAYALISFMKLKKEVSVCVPVGKCILSCDEVKSPFILGVLRPTIYVPSSVCEETLDLMICHEKAHLQHHDHLWKPLAYLLLAVYWFNPLCWIAYILFGRDLEMACDERVVQNMDKAELVAYSQALLDCSLLRRKIAVCPLGFGEVGVKERVKGVLNYKKPAFLVILCAIIFCIVTGVCLMTDPFSRNENPAAQTDEIDVASLRKKYPEYFDLSTGKGLELYVWEMAQGDYRCGLMSGTNRDKDFEELISLKGASIGEMKAILSTYDIDEDEIIIIPWQNPLSSYLPEWAIQKEGESYNTFENRQHEFCDKIRKMLRLEEGGLSD